MIISPQVVSLVKEIETTNTLTSENFKKLLSLLSQSCLKSQPERQALTLKDFPSKYPEEHGYAKSFDVLTQEKQLLEHWHHYGFVVGSNVISYQNSEKTIQRILDIINHLGMSFENPQTWLKDSNQTSILSRGFFELYHDDCLAQIRQSLRLYLYHVVLWGTPYLWTSFDRLGIKVPQDGGGLPLHVDQNPTVHPNFQTIQGVVALQDCPKERGTFVAVPQSIELFEQYSNYIAPGYKGEYIRLAQDSILSQNIQPIALKQGSIVSWDSRLTHANSSNLSDKNRYVAYVSTGIVNKAYQQTRVQAFEDALGENNRNAYMHASKKPRFTNTSLMQSIREKEKLNDLGQVLYGLKNYEDYL